MAFLCVAERNRSRKRLESKLDWQDGDGELPWCIHCGCLKYIPCVKRSARRHLPSWEQDERVPLWRLLGTVMSKPLHDSVSLPKWSIRSSQVMVILNNTRVEMEVVQAFRLHLNTRAITYRLVCWVSVLVFDSFSICSNLLLCLRSNILEADRSLK